MIPRFAALTLGCCLAISLFSGAVTASPSAHSTVRDETMTTIAKGEFDVKITPQPADDLSAGGMGRMSIDKILHGDLEGTSKGEMLTAMSADVKDSGVYVAVERVTGTLHGRKGSFALHHTGIMDRGQQNLTVTIVPDSGTGELTGISGTMKIIIDGKKHFYEFDYRIGSR
jgi:hypothetical protein